MTPRRFRINRIIRILYTDPTGAVEAIVSFCYIFMPGISLALGKTEFPTRTAVLLDTLTTFHNEHFLGIILVTLALGQMWGAGTEWHKVRAVIATIIAAAIAVIVLAYGFSGEAYRWTVPMMSGTVITQMFVAWRNWHERPLTHDELIRIRQKHNGCS
jgi:hypothetical protein